MCRAFRLVFAFSLLPGLSSQLLVNHTSIVPGARTQPTLVSRNSSLKHMSRCCPVASPHILLWHAGQAELALSLWWGRAIELELEILGVEEDQLSNFLTL